MAPTSRSRSPLLWWVAAFVLHRAAVIAFAFDGVFFWEEAYRLLAAEALRDGWKLPLHELQADPYSGGSLVFSILAAAVTSPSLLALKGVALAWSALGMWLWLLVADRVCGRAAANALGLVWLAAPPIFVVLNVVALGSHSDTVTLTGLQLLLMFRYLEDSERAGRLLAWTAAAGFAIWFSYASALPVAVGAAYALACGALPPTRWPAAALGLTAGFSPWIAYSLAGGGSLDVVAQTFTAGPNASPGYLSRLYDVIARGVPAALYFRNIGIPADVKLSREALAYPYLAVYAASFVAVMARPLTRLGQAFAQAAGTRAASLRRALAACPELPILALFPSFLVVIAASNQEFNDLGMVRWITFRILVPALPSLFFAVALAASRARAPVRRVVLTAYAVLALVGSGQLLADGSQGHAQREASAREIGAEAMGHLLVLKHGTQPVVRDRIEAIPAELRASAWRGVGFSVAYLYGTKRGADAVSDLTRALRAVDGTYRTDSLEGARLAVGPGLPQVAPLLPSARRDAIAAAIDEAGS